MNHNLVLSLSAVLLTAARPSRYAGPPEFARMFAVAPRYLALFAAVLVSTPAFAASATASSVMTDGDGKHPADLAFDGLLGTGWAEGEMGPGAGSWVELDLGSETEIENVSFWPGNLARGERTFKEYSRPKVVQLWVDGQKVGDPLRIQSVMERVDMKAGAKGRKVRLEFVEAFEGGVFTDLFVAEVAINFTEGERTRQVATVEKWRTSKSGESLQKKYEEQALAAYDKHKADPNDRASLEFLMDAAGEGPEYLRKQVSSLVPAGYRAAAIVPDEMAMSAIRKLKDPTGIPGLEYAAMRAIGKQQREIIDTIEYFRAWRDLQSGGRHNIDAWGETGWEVGAFLSHGEPLPIEIDQFGNALVADTGNNRIQRFTTQGITDKQWGAPKDVSEYWFGAKRAWYAAGSMATDDGGAFMNPIDIELIPGKEADGFMVLDAAGRLQIFDEEGNGKIGWTVAVEDQVQPKVGGEGYLGWVAKKKRIVVTIGNDAVVYDPASEEVGRWVIKDGTPNAVEIGPDSKIYMTFGDKVVTYNLDGFRYGTVIDEKILGAGFEDVDLSFDEKGALWALTDTGWVFKFKKPGKLDWSVRVVDHELIHPRFAVFQGNVLVTDRDRILPLDAAQLHADEVAAKEEEASAKKEAGK